MAAKKSPAKKAAKKTVNKATAKKAPAKKAPVKKSPAKKTTTKKASKKAPARRKATKTLRRPGKKVTNSTPAKPDKKAAPKKVSTAKTANGTNEVHGVRVLGDARKGGTAKKGIVAQLSLDQITIPKGLNPRRDVGDVTELQRSIKTEGVLSSLVVRPGKKVGQFELIAGERRFRSLEKLDWKDVVPVVIRTDLDDDLHARAVAVAENETGTKLNPIEVGRVVLDLSTKRKWPASRIANETGQPTHAVHSALKLMETPPDIQKRVEAGTMSVRSGLEIAKIPKPDREKIAAQIGPDTASSEIKRMRKELDREAKADKAARGEKDKTKEGKDRERVVVAWRSARDKQLMLQELCYQFRHEYDDDDDSAERSEVRGMLAAIFWDRGDLSLLVLPAEKKADMENEDKEMKDLKLLDSLIDAAAAKHEPEGDPVE